MPTSFPGGIDSFTNPNASDPVTSPSHSSQHANLNDAVEAIERHTGEVDAVFATSDVSITATTEGTANTVLTGGAHNYDGSTTVLIEFSAHKVRCPAGVAATITFYLYDNGASIGGLGVVMNNAASAMDVPLFLRRRWTPSAGSHQFSVRAAVSTGTGFVGAGTGASGQQNSALLRVVRA